MKPTLSLIVPLFAALSPAQGTGKYYNVESPQVKPIAVARVAGHDYLLVCNTPDNAVEIYDTHTNARVARVRTGAEPISVEFNPVNGKLYTCNFLGDSITIASLSATGPTAPLQVALEGTVFVGDEPADVAFSSDGLTVLITLSSRSQIRALDANTLVPVVLTADPFPMLAANPAPLLGFHAIKEPRAIVVAPSSSPGPNYGRAIVVNNKGGKIFGLGAPFEDYDADLWTIDLNTGVTSIKTIPGLGTTNHGVAVASNGDVWVVGTDALAPGISVAGHAAAPTGFVTSNLWRVSNIGSATPTIAKRDLNTLSTSTGTVGGPVPRTRALAQPTDVALLESSGAVRKIYVSAFHSDRIGIVTPTGAPTAWGIRTLNIPTVPQANPGSVSGPRGLVLKSASGIAGDPGSRLYVMNRLDNSVTVINTASDSIVASFPLAQDPTPAYVKTGRQFLYSSNFSGNGFVSCASCHVDGRTDNLGWDLSNGTSQPFAPNFVDGVNAIALFPNFPANKRVMVTQSLQGLATYEVNSSAQKFVTTEPLHWRGDKATFADFNEAFVNLQGAFNIGTPTDPKGLTVVQMEAFRAAVFSIHYPPNPEQPINRVYSGTPGSPNVVGSGTGAREGNKLFHQRALGTSLGGIECAGRSCVQCHALMSGGNKLFTVFGVSFLNGVSAQPLESSAMRLLRQKESMLTLDGNPSPTGVTMGTFGTEHEGKTDSINDFIGTFFGADFPATNELQNVNQFSREFDTGTAPAVGLSFTASTVTPAGDIATALGFGESQSQVANAGLAITGVIAGVERGFWFDPIVGLYREEPSGVMRTRAQVLALLAAPADRLVFHATPLGSERRFAWPSVSAPAPIVGASPSNLVLEAMPTNTAWTDVPAFENNWDPLATAGIAPLTWTSAVPTPPSLRTMRLFQRELVAVGGFGLTKTRHEAPRRFAVSGTNIRHGAVLLLSINADPTQPPATSTAFQKLQVPLHMTNRIGSNGNPIWESHVELDPFETYVMLMGGPSAQGVQTTINSVFANTLLGETLPPGTVDPINWNRFGVTVVNEDGTNASGGLQALRLN